jgi:hypothetical protein
MIHKKEKQFALTGLSKWSIILTNMLTFASPFIILMDHFKNNYMKNSGVSFKTIIPFVLVFSTFMFFTNLIICFIYEVKFIKKLSDRVRSVSRCILPANSK